MSSDSDDEDGLVSQGYRPSRNRDASEDDGPHTSKADRSTIRISEGVDEVSHCRDVLQHEHEGEDQHDGGREPGHLLLCFAPKVQRGCKEVQAKCKRNDSRDPEVIYFRKCTRDVYYTIKRAIVNVVKILWLVPYTFVCFASQDKA